MSVLVPMIRRLKILHIDTMELVDFPLNWAQIELLDEIERQLRSTGRARVIVDKARQLGVSTVVQGLKFTFATMIDNYRGLTLAHEEEGSKHLLSMSHTFWENWAFRDMLTQRTGSESALAWDNGSSMRISTARSKGASRGRTFSFLHGSEVGFWPDPTTTMTGVRQAIPNTDFSVIVLESTANGVGNWFHKTWESAVAGDSEYTPLFFPWHRHPRYKASAIGLEYASLGKLSPEERALHQAGVDSDSLAWRRWAVRNLTENNEQLFMQEYPSNADESFLSTGTNVFPLLKLLAIYRPKRGARGRLFRDGAKVRFVEDDAGPLTVFSRPSQDKDWGRYIVGADATHTTFGDFAVGQVLNRRSLEQVAVYRDRVDPGTFAEEMFKLALFYNTALLAPEKEGPGQQVIGRVLGMNYPNVFQHARIDRTPGKVITDRWGWSTTAQTKHFAIGELLKQVVDGINPMSDLGLCIHDERTFTEMKNFVTLPDGGFGNANGEDHDDTVMGMAIAVACNKLDGPIAVLGENDEPYWLPQPEPAEPPAWESWEEVH